MSANSDFGTWGRYKEIPLDKMTPDQKLSTHDEGAWASTRSLQDLAAESEGGLPPLKVQALIAGLPISLEDPRQQVVYELTYTTRGAIANRPLSSRGLDC
jgi:hypothetical protein